MLIPGVRAHDYGRDEPERLFEKIAADGYTALMLACQKAIAGISSYYDVTDTHVQAIQSALKKHHLSLRTLGVYMELGLVDEDGRKRAVEQFQQGIRVAAKLGVPTVATETTALKTQPGVDRQQALKSLYRSLEEILPVAQEHKVMVCPEPVFYHTLATPEMTRQLLKDMACPYLGVTFDPVNLMDVCDEATQHSLWDRCFDCFGDNIEVVHMKGIKIEQGVLARAGFEDSVVDYPYLFSSLRKLSKTIHVIREEANPAIGKQEHRFLEALCNG